MGGSSVLEQIAFQQQQQGGPSRGSSMLSSAGSMLPDGKKIHKKETLYLFCFCRRYLHIQSSQSSQYSQY